jgi:hypothetical protein
VSVVRDIWQGPLSVDRDQGDVVAVSKQERKDAERLVARLKEGPPLPTVRSLIPLEPGENGHFESAGRLEYWNPGADEYFWTHTNSFAVGHPAFVVGTWLLNAALNARRERKAEVAAEPHWEGFDEGELTIAGTRLVFWGRQERHSIPYDVFSTVEAAGDAPVLVPKDLQRFPKLRLDCRRPLLAQLWLSYLITGRFDLLEAQEQEEKRARPTGRTSVTASRINGSWR